MLSCRAGLRENKSELRSWLIGGPLVVLRPQEVRFSEARVPTLARGLLRRGVRAGRGPIPYISSVLRTQPVYNLIDVTRKSGRRMENLGVGWIAAIIIDSLAGWLARNL